MRKKKGKKSSGPVSDSIDALEKNGNYFFDLKISVWRKLWLFADLLIFSIIYISLAFLLSWTFDKYTVRELNRNQSDAIIICEIIAQLLLIMVLIYFVIVVIGRRIPSLYPNPPKEHIAFKSYVLTMLLIFGIFAGESKFQAKIRHVFNPTADNEIEALEHLAVCFHANSFGTSCPKL